MAARAKRKTKRRVRAKKSQKTKKLAVKAMRKPSIPQKAKAGKTKKITKLAKKRPAVAKRVQKPVTEASPVLVVRPGETVIVETLEQPGLGVVVVSEAAVSVEAGDEED